MTEKLKLKNDLIEMSKNEWRISHEMNLDELAMQMVKHIGDVDPVLRDELILTGLYHMIYEKKLSMACMKQIFCLLISDTHLFYNIGNTSDDSVLKRTFSMLIIGVLIDYHHLNGKELLSNEDIENVIEKMIVYLKKEKDLRGYVEASGWAHALAHAGDTIAELSVYEHLSVQQALQLLEGIRDAYCVTTCVLINEEAERLTTAIVKYYEKFSCHEAVLRDWVLSFSRLEAPNSYPLRHYFNENLKNLLRSLYFRLKRNGGYENHLSTIENLLNEITTY